MQASEASSFGKETSGPAEPLAGLRLDDLDHGIFEMVNGGSSASECVNPSTLHPSRDEEAIARLDPKPGELILDVGCGDGALSATILEAGAKVIGLDPCEKRVEAARARGVDAFLADPRMRDLPAHADRFGHFDAVYSNSAFQIVHDPDISATAIFQALKPGGRFVGEMDGRGDLDQLWEGFSHILAERGYSPGVRISSWRPDVEEFTRLHCVAGFTQIHAELVDLPTLLSEGARGWVLSDRSPELDLAMIPQWEREDIADAVEHRLKASLGRSDGRFHADHVRLRFAMKKPG